MLLVQISDLHITEPGTLLCGRVDTASLLQRCVARLLTLTTPIDAVIITGDLVDRGTVTEYRLLQELLAPLTMPVRLLLGNHDDRSAFGAVFGNQAYLVSSGAFVQYSFDLAGFRIITLDTNDPGKPGGRLCGERRAWLVSELEKAKNQRVVIALHHPPFATGIPPMDIYGLAHDDAAALAIIVARYSNIERVICGHLHRSITTRFAGTVAMTAPSCGHQLALDFRTDAPLQFMFEPPAFLQHHWDGAVLTTHHTYIDAFDGPYRF
jgi:3',5'-cyclic-AMP phosphodiesterase